MSNIKLATKSKISPSLVHKPNHDNNASVELVINRWAIAGVLFFLDAQVVSRLPVSRRQTFLQSAVSALKKGLAPQVITPL